METRQNDKRPDPKPRKHIQLWQAYQQWYELSEMRKRHVLRISSVERGKSTMDAQMEKDFMEGLALDLNIEGGRVPPNLQPIYGKKTLGAKGRMAQFGEECGPIWGWVTGIHGIGNHLAAQLLAQIDDIGKFATVSKLWRFAGLAVIDGKAEGMVKGEKSHKNRTLEAILWNIGDSFIKKQTPIYVDIYYTEKDRLRRLHPEPVKNPPGSFWKNNYTDAHIHNMAKRKMIKIFVQHLWVKWRTFEGLSVSQPYVQAILGHTHIIEVK